jgi:rSAM/selenodomain-associated transferase 1
MLQSSGGKIPLDTDMADNRLLIFAKPPLPGKVKSRLIPALGAEGAASIHREMAEYTLGWAAAFRNKKNWTVEAWFSGGRKAAVEWLREGWDLWEQRGVDIGARIFNAFFDVFRAGCRKAVMVGTDCPELTAAHVRRAITALNDHDVVLGPTREGGYCLVGLKEPRPELFFGIPWGTKQVLETTLLKAREEGLSVRRMEPLRDVEYPQDLAVWNRVKNGNLSIIIPTLNEGEALLPTLDRIEKDARTEVIVSDGGSGDHTMDTARSWGARIVVSSSPDRGAQMNKGAQAAGGSILLFLRPGTQLPENYASLIRDAQKDPEISIGAFPVRLEKKSLSLSSEDKAVTGYSRKRYPAWGEQVLFMRNSLFRELGGFREIPNLEDLDLTRCALKWGDLALLSSPVFASLSRQANPEKLNDRMRKRLAVMGYKLGLSPRILAALFSMSSRKGPE